VCEVFSSRIYVADSRRDSDSMYFGKRGMTNSHLLTFTVFFNNRLSTKYQLPHYQYANNILSFSQPTNIMILTHVFWPALIVFPHFVSVG